MGEQASGDQYLSIRSSIKKFKEGRGENGGREWDPTKFDGKLMPLPPEHSHIHILNSCAQHESAPQHNALSF